MTPWTAACQITLSFTISWSLLKFMSIESVMLSNHLILCRPLLLGLQSFPKPASFPTSQLFTSGAKVLELQLQHQSFQWIFRVDFLQDWQILSPFCPRDSQKSSPALRFKSINSLVLSLLYGPTLTSIYDYRKTIALTIGTFVGKMMSLPFNILSRLSYLSFWRASIF